MFGKDFTALALAFTISTEVAQPGQGKPPPGHAAKDPEPGTFLVGGASSGGYAVDVTCDTKCWGAEYDDRGGRGQRGLSPSPSPPFLQS
jgi:hypothetical protein